MATIRDITFKLIEKVPDDYIYWLNQTIRKFIADNELENEDDELKINGVVYSEMKGAFSDPDDIVERQIMQVPASGEIQRCQVFAL